MMRLFLLLVISIFFNLTAWAHAQVSVGGQLSRNSTFSLSDSPYYIDQSLWIPKNVRLVIEPGVELIFRGPHLILVEGELVAQGTKDAPIIFTSGNIDKNPGDWKGIIFNSTSRPAYFDASGNYLSGSVIQHSEISFGGLIQLNSSSPFISENHIHHLKGVALNDWPAGAIWSCNSFARISNNLIEQNPVSGLALLSSASNIVNNRIQNNRGADGWGGGLLLGGGECDNAEDEVNANSISNNFIGYNSASDMGGGIAIVSGTHQIQGNCLIGNQTPLVRDTNYGGAAIGSWSQQTIIRGNHFSDNIGREALQMALTSENSMLFTQNNMINPFSTFELGLIGFPNADATNQANANFSANFWDTNDLALLMSRIEDKNDDSLKPLAQLDPLLTTASQVASCSMAPNQPIEINAPDSRKTVQVSDFDSLLKQVSISTKSFRKEGGVSLVLVTLSADAADADISAWVTTRRKGIQSGKATLGMNCHEKDCMALIKIDALSKITARKNRRLLKRYRSDFIAVTLHTSLNGRISSRSIGSIRVKNR